MGYLRRGRAVLNGLCMENARLRVCLKIAGMIFKARAKSGKYIFSGIFAKQRERDGGKHGTFLPFF